MYRVKQQQQQTNFSGVESSEDSDVIVTVSSTADEENKEGQSVNSNGKVPKMVGRSHLFEGIPEDIRRYFVHTHIEGTEKNLEGIAINLRLYSQISKEHHKEVVAILNEDAYVDVSRISTRNALPCLAEFEPGENKRKIKYTLRVKELVDTYMNCYANFSLTKEAEGLSKGLRAAGLTKVFKGQGSKSLVIDISNENFRSEEGSRYFNPWSGEEFISWGSKKSYFAEEKKLIKTLITELAKHARKNKSLPLIHLICKEQAFHQVALPLIKNIANSCDSLQGIQTLNLGYNTSIEKYLQMGMLSHYELIMNEIWDCAEFLGKILKESKSLQTLKVNNMYIISMGLIQIAEGLASNNNLSTLDLSNNPLTGKNVPNWHKNLDKIICDYLSSDLSSKYWGISKLAEVLKKNTFLKTLHLAACDLDDKAADMLLSMLNENKGLERIDLSSNNIRNDHPVFLDERVYLDEPELSVYSLDSSSDDDS